MPMIRTHSPMIPRTSFMGRGQTTATSQLMPLSSYTGQSSYGSSSLPLSSQTYGGAQTYGGQSGRPVVVPQNYGGQPQGRFQPQQFQAGPQGTLFQKSHANDPVLGSWSGYVFTPDEDPQLQVVLATPVNGMVRAVWLPDGSVKMHSRPEVYWPENVTRGASGGGSTGPGTSGHKRGWHPFHPNRVSGLDEDEVGRHGGGGRGHGGHRGHGHHHGPHLGYGAYCDSGDPSLFCDGPVVVSPLTPFF